jgi:hypothetical protein
MNVPIHFAYHSETPCSRLVQRLKFTHLRLHNEQMNLPILRTGGGNVADRPEDRAF